MRAAVFIDNSNIFRCINTMREAGEKQWPNFYDPLFLARRLAGNRELVYVGFYCVSPPYYLMQGNDNDQYRYTTTQKYYTEIAKQDLVEVKYGDLKYSQDSKKREPHEKNVDTQLVSDLLGKAAFNEYDVAIIAANDGDYASGIEWAKKLGRKIEVMFFKGFLSDNLRKIAITRRARPSFFKRLNF